MNEGIVRHAHAHPRLGKQKCTCKFAVRTIIENFNEYEWWRWYLEAEFIEFF